MESSPPNLGKYQSRDTDVLDIDLRKFNPSVLSSRSIGVYKQWQFDKTDQILVDGYFRECDITTQPLSKDISLTIASYYTKARSKGVLKRKIERLQRDKRLKREHQMAATRKCLLIFITLSALLSLICGSDISSLVIASQYDCDTVLNTHGVNNFLFIGSIVHIVAVMFLFLLSCVLWRFNAR
eukprot:781537_1